jgi:dTDP-4-amino-4,6-dideoxygalactose transaminase
VERYLAASRKEGWFSNFGPCWRVLRDRLSEATGRSCVPVASGTLGLVVAIAALKRRGPAGATQALMPSFAFSAPARAAVWNGLEPVFVDVARDHWHLDPDALERALAIRRGEVAIVLPLSAFGTPPPPSVRERWIAACAAAQAPLLIDSAAGFGAVAEDGLPTGAQGDMEVVSFDAVKPLAAGEGGAVFTATPELAEELLRLANFGFDDQRQAVLSDGINAKMSEPAAALSLAALDEYPAALAHRRAAAKVILSELPPGFGPQHGCTRGTWQFVPVTAPDREARASVVAAAQGLVETRTYYDPLHRMPAFARCARASELGTTDWLADRILSLPMSGQLTDEELATIIGVLRTAAQMPVPAVYQSP